MGIPVVIASNGRGICVRNVTSGAPVMTVATNGFGIPIVLGTTGIPFVVQGAGPATLATLSLSGTLRNNLSSSGTILGATPTSTIVSNVSGLTVNSGARTYTWDGTGAAGSTSNGLVETLVGATGSPKSTSITVLAAVTLATLSLSGTITNGTSSSGTITGASTGSTIVSNVTGLTVNSGARTYSWDGTGAAGATSNGLVETLSGAIGSPKNSSITVAAAAGATPDTPVLSNLSSGWTTGDNPPAWKSTYTNVQGYASGSGAGDQLRARWRFGAGAWTTTSWEPLDTELMTGAAVPWPFLTDGSLNAGGAFDVQEQIVRDLSLGTEAFSAWSTSWTDTIASVITAPTIVHLRTEEIDGAYGTGPFAPATAVSCLSGDKILITIFGHYSGSGGVSGITANAGGLTWTQAGTGTAAGSDRVQSFWCDVGAVTSLTLSFAVAAATDKLDIEINAVRGAVAGAPMSTYYEIRSVTNTDPHDIDGNLNPPTSGAAVYSIGAGSGAIAFTGATALAAQVNGKYFVRSAYKLTTTGDVTIGGNASGGPSYTDILIANSKWNHP